jgi:hypothetical protein
MTTDDEDPSCCISIYELHHAIGLSFTIHLPDPIL